MDHIRNTAITSTATGAARYFGDDDTMLRQHCLELAMNGGEHGGAAIERAKEFFKYLKGEKVFTREEMRAAWIAGRKHLTRFELGDENSLDFFAWLEQAAASTHPTPPKEEALLTDIPKTDRPNAFENAVEPGPCPPGLQPILPIRLHVESFAEPHTVDRGRAWGKQRPLACLWVEARNQGEAIGWSGAYIRLDQGTDQVAEALEKLAAQLRTGQMSVAGDRLRSGNELNREGVADLLLPHE